MSQYITKIRTESGDLQIDYNALANLPTINDRLLNEDFTLSASDVGAATADHIHITLNPDQYGDELPNAGTPGRFFFKKVV